MSNDEFEDPYVLALKKPIELGITYTSLTLTEPTAGQVEEASRKPNNHATNIHLITLVAKVPEPVVRQVGNRDYEKAVEYLESFFGTRQKTGAKS